MQDTFIGKQEVFAYLTGVFIHIFYFNRGEHHMHGVKVLQGSIFSLSAFASWIFFAFERPLKQSLLDSLCSHAFVILGLYSSLVAYRLFWHPFRQFPGPWSAKITSLWFSAHIGRNDAHKKIYALHQKYGHYVRIGSSDLSIAHPLGVGVVYGPKSTCRKASWYDEDYPRASIHTTRDHHFHTARKRVWSQAFNDKSLRGYEVRIARYIDRLVQMLQDTDSKAVNVSQWFKYFSFDVMGDLAFGKDFGMLKNGQEHWAVGLLNEAMGVQGRKLPTWIFRMMVAVPGLTEKYWRFIGYCDEQLIQRIENKSEVPDIMSTLLDHAGSPPIQPDEFTTLQADSRTIIVAGSDTTAATLAHIFYYLAKHPNHTRKIRDELSTILGDLSLTTPALENRKVQYAEHLNAVIYETLRLNPAVPSAIVRKTPPEGITISDTYIAGGMNVWCPQYVLGRSEEIYDKPLEFIPERWYSQSSMVKEKSAYAPFSTGTYGCIGKPLAMMEMRAVVAELVKKFDIGFGKEDTGEKFIADTTDQFTLHLADLNLQFTPRN